MKLWLITRPSYDSAGQFSEEYDSAVVAAETEEDARRIHPVGVTVATVEDEWPDFNSYEWVPANQVVVTLLGMAESEVEAGVVVASFNAS